MKEIKVSVNSWYVVEGTAGATVTNPSTNRVIATIEDGKQAAFYATTPYVLASDDSVSVYKSTFNSAPVKLRLLGLLGGGVQSVLPSGYLAAAFLESDGNAYMEVPLVVNTNESAVKLETVHCNTGGGGWKYEGIKGTFGQGMYDKTRFCVYVNSNGFPAGELTTNGWNKHVSIFEANVATQVLPSGEEVTRSMGAVEIESYKLFLNGTQYWESFPGKKKNWRATVGGVVQFDLIPVIAENGDSGMLNKVDNVFYGNLGTKPFIVGFTLAQARKLADLPATGGTLTVSLPTGYESDAAVGAALQSARANGWTLTIQTYTPEAEASAAVTFGMRRIWVRKTQDENGMYVDADGKRWTVDWCVEMYTPDGSTPDAHGYELFRSVDAAVAYWELEPYVDPEAEEHLTEYNANE